MSLTSTGVATSATARQRILEVGVTLARHLLRVALAAARRVLVDLRDPPIGAVAAREMTDAFAELGPTFIKLGQVLSTRPDLVPPAFEAALSSLQDAAPAEATSSVRRAIKDALGSEPEQCFAQFSAVPLAAASIGQVHAATLQDGREVVVKVRRAGVEQRVELDLAIMHRLAQALVMVSGTFRRLDVIGFVEEFASTIRGELDYVREGHNAERIGSQLKPLGVHVPFVVWTHTRADVLTLERIRGAKIDDLAALDALGVDRPQIARQFAEAYLAMVFLGGFFHADPHPGNLFVEPSGRVALVDFGMVGTVTPEVRRALVEILLALSTGDMMRSVRALRALGVLRGAVADRQIASELEPISRTTVEVPVGELRLAPLLAQMMAVIRRRRLHFPRELALLVKTVVMCEGLAAQLDESFSLAAVIVPFAGRVLSATTVDGLPIDDPSFRTTGAPEGPH